MVVWSAKIHNIDIVVDGLFILNLHRKRPQAEEQEKLRIFYNVRGRRDPSSCPEEPIVLWVELVGDVDAPFRIRARRVFPELFSFASGVLEVRSST